MKGWCNEGRVKIALKRISNYIKNLEESVVTDAVPLSISAYVTDERLPISSTFTLDRHPVSIGEVWGSSWQSAYFKVKADLSSFQTEDLALKISLGGEMLIYDENALPLMGLTSVSAFNATYKKDIYRFQKRSDEETFFIEVAANDIFGLKRDEVKRDRNCENAKASYVGAVEYAYVGVYQEEIWQLLMEAKALYSLYKAIADKTSTRSLRILSALLDSADKYPVDGVNAARNALKKELEKPACASALEVFAIGHAHIDTAWLWPLAETKRKVTRTFASQIANIKQYPDYIFGASSPQQYAWLKESHPALYEEIKEAVKAGRWETLGAMWIEPDCTLTSTESLIRQIIEGKKFFQKEFGIDVRNCWIPDTFGYPSTLPQIMKKAGVDYLCTQKISWCSSTKFPYDSFIWVGLDGSEVVAHFLPEHNYNSDGNAEAFLEGEKNFLEKDRLNSFISAIGMGDGGGGPKEEHIEQTRLLKNLEGSPKAQFRKVSDFFEKLNDDKDILEKYRGELYLELHRGTLTSQARNKKLNRQFEEFYRVLEILALELKEYPTKMMKEILRSALTMQFHDILPGSSVKEVYEETEILYREIRENFRRIMEEYFTVKVPTWKGFAYSMEDQIKKVNENDYCQLFNATGIKGNQLLWINTNNLVNVSISGHKTLPLGRKTVVYLPVEKCGWNTYSLEKTIDVETVDSFNLSNREITYEFGKDGSILHATRKDGTDYCREGKGNKLHLYADTPANWEAWDIDFFYKDQEIKYGITCVGMKKIASGELEIMRIDYKMGNSSMTQYAVLPKDGEELYFYSEVDWHEERKLLRVDFPCPKDSEFAVSDIGYGNVKRRINVQNEGDWAKFEFSGRTFTDVSNEDWGVALLSDSKYGFSARDGRLGLSLLRSPIDPDLYADQGEHSFIYCFMPHAGSLNDNHVREKANVLNSPNLVVITEKAEISSTIPVEIEGVGCRLEILKKAEEGDSYVFRVVETNGRRGSFIFHGKGQYQECNLLEKLISSITVEDGTKVSLNPYEIKTFKKVMGNEQLIKKV